MSRMFGPDQLLECYRRGVFPMGDSADDPRLFIVDPDRRGVLPVSGFHIPGNLRRTVLRDTFDVRVDTAFSEVMVHCSEPGRGREKTWINTPILNLYGALHRRGHAHSVECWREGRLVGGLYGVVVGGAFFGESMFSRETDASKTALVHLAARLVRGGFVLHDTQFVTPHLQQFGAEEIERKEFHSRLEIALRTPADFSAAGPRLSGQEAVQLITQTS